MNVFITPTSKSQVSFKMIFRKPIPWGSLNQFNSDFGLVYWVCFVLVGFGLVGLVGIFGLVFFVLVSLVWVGM